jgi:hypothetical protein
MLIIYKDERLMNKLMRIGQDCQRACDDKRIKARGKSASFSLVLRAIQRQMHTWLKNRRAFGEKTIIFGSPRSNISMPPLLGMAPL